MKPNTLSALVSYKDHFEIIELGRRLEDYQKVVGGYIEGVPRPSLESGWMAYCNEEGKLEKLPINTDSNRFLNRLYAEEGAPPFTNFDVLVGNIIWLGEPDDGSGDDDSLPIEQVIKFINVAVPEESGLLTVMRDGNDIWVSDQLSDSLIPQQVAERVRAARSREEHGTIEVWANVTPPRWVDLRVELMDHYQINVHDHREDRSYG